MTNISNVNKKKAIKESNCTMTRINKSNSIVTDGELL